MTSFLCAVVRKPNHPAKVTTNAVTVASLATVLSSSRHRTHIADIKKPIEIIVPTKVTNFCIFCSFTYVALSFTFSFASSSAFLVAFFFDSGVCKN